MTCAPVSRMVVLLFIWIVHSIITIIQSENMEEEGEKDKGDEEEEEDKEEKGAEKDEELE